jgi:hypothetical protein
MDNIEEVEARVDELYQKSEDLNAELYTLGAVSERMEIFAHLRELISEKEAVNDTVAAEVLGWAYERLAVDWI